MGGYRIYMWNVDKKKKKLTYAAYTSFPEILEYELRLRVVLTLLITGVLYDDEQIRQVRRQFKEATANIAQAATAAKQEAAQATHVQNLQTQKAHKAKVSAEKKAKYQQERLGSAGGKEEKGDEIDEKCKDGKEEKGETDA